jgi:allophanate hydrolase subunit 2
MTALLATVGRVGVATLQDGGRSGYSEVGVPVAGAWHRGRYNRACALLTGNADATVPSIELLAGELTLRTSLPLVMVVAGPALMRVDADRSATGTVVRVTADVSVTVTHQGPGPVYVTVSGWQAERTLGSCSVDTFSHLGGSALAVGDELRGDASPFPADRVGWFQRPERAPSGPVRVVLTDADHATGFLTRTWVVERMARSGVRLRSPSWRGPTESVESFPVVPGAIQLTPEGEAIVLGPDGGLTGGYPVVAVVASVDLDRISCLVPGAGISFSGIDPGTAHRAWAEGANLRAGGLAHPAMLT